MSRVKNLRRVMALSTMLPALLGISFSIPSQAQAQDVAGRVCLFQDAEGASGYGHTAWAFRHPTETGRWIWGSTDGDGTSMISPGSWKTNNTWHDGGSWSTLRESLNPGTYDHYRCINTATADLASAQEAYQKARTSGYALLSNNCLTKAMKILRSYSPVLKNTGFLHVPTVYPSYFSMIHAPSASGWAPNTYFYKILDYAKGWSKAQAY